MDDSIEQQITLHLNVWCGMLERYLEQRKIAPDPRSSEVEKLARHWESNRAFTEAEWIRNCTSMDNYRRALDNTRALLRVGELGRAFAVHQKFERERWHIAALLDQPDIKRGRKIVRSGAAGHELIHGSINQKRERWQAIYNDWQSEKERGTPKPALVVAARHGVSERQVYRSKTYLAKND